MLFKLGSDVLDSRERAQNVNLLVRRIDVNLQSAVVRAHANMLVVIVNFNEFAVRVLF